MSRFIAPMVEVELAFVLGKRLEGVGVTIFDVLSATDYVIHAIEIIDARIQRLDPVTKRPRRVFDTISANAANSGIVMGGRPVRPLDVDLRWGRRSCRRTAASKIRASPLRYSIIRRMVSRGS